MKRIRNFQIASISLLAAFLLWTVAICFVDVRPIGPRGSSVGFAGINGFVHNLTGVNFKLYTVTDLLGIVPILVCVSFGMLGLYQWIKRKSIRRVDPDVLLLGIFYIITIAAFFLFERLAINYRPVLIGGILEASYPSSTTMLVTCVMPTLPIQLDSRIKNKAIRITVSLAVIAFIAFMVIARLISGVHWFSDIVGGALFGAGLVTLYYAAAASIAPID